jgi:HAD superfamily hydrolase (TIGR01549 family)
VPATLAVLWDFDGTLVDTRRRNFNVVRRLIPETTGKAVERIPALVSAEVYDQVNRRYSNWRELYAREFGLSEEETDRIGGLWSEYQARDDTPADLFDGIRDALRALRGIAQGIVSQNASEQIRRTLAEAQLADHFRVVIGYDDVDIKRQKPEPDGFLACLSRLTGLAPGRVLYVGDHETDVRCARNAARALAVRGAAVEIVSVAACFAGHAGPVAWRHQPDWVAWSPQRVAEIALQ